MADITLEINGAIGELVLNRPAARNAITRAMWRDIPALLGKAANDPGIRVLVIHGGQSGVFSAGADISELGKLKDNEDEAVRFHGEMTVALGTLASFPKPVIARIEGPCIGAGMALALCCDMRFAGSTARFGITPAKLGLIYPLGDTRRLVTLIGPARAKDILLSSRLMDADEAQRMGLIEQVVPADEIIAYTLGRAQEMAGRSLFTQQAMKRMINSLSEFDPAAEAQSREIFAQCFSGKDFAEGYAAFTQKRKPDFS